VLVRVRSWCRGFGVSGSAFRVSDFGFRVMGHGFRVSGSGDSGSGFRVQDSGFRVSCFVFRVSGFGLGFGDGVEGSDCRGETSSSFAVTTSTSLKTAFWGVET